MFVCSRFIFSPYLTAVKRSLAIHFHDHYTLILVLISVCHGGGSKSSKYNPDPNLLDITLIPANGLVVSTLVMAAMLRCGLVKSGSEIPEAGAGSRRWECCWYTILGVALL